MRQTKLRLSAKRAAVIETEISPALALRLAVWARVNEIDETEMVNRALEFAIGEEDQEPGMKAPGSEETIFEIIAEIMEERR